MKFGIAFANTALYTSTAGAIALAQRTEAVGVDSLWTVEHRRGLTWSRRDLGTTNQEW